MSGKRMPISRDTRVNGPSGLVGASPTPQENGAEVASSKAAPCLVTVMGFGGRDVLFRSDKANIVQWRDSNGEVVALLVRLKPDIWGFSRRGDDDWEEVLSLYGNRDVT